MKQWSWAAAVVALAVVAGLGRADLIPGGGGGRPKPPPAKPPVVPQVPAVVEAPFNVAIDDNAKEPVLYVPRKLLNSLRADAGDPDPDTRRTEAVPNLHIVVSGVALAAALAL